MGTIKTKKAKVLVNDPKNGYRTVKYGRKDRTQEQFDVIDRIARQNHSQRKKLHKHSREKPRVQEEEYDIPGADHLEYDEGNEPHYSQTANEPPSWDGDSNDENDDSRPTENHEREMRSIQDWSSVLPRFSSARFLNQKFSCIAHCAEYETGEITCVGVEGMSAFLHLDYNVLIYSSQNNNLHLL